MTKAFLISAVLALVPGFALADEVVECTTTKSRMSGTSPNSLEVKYTIHDRYAVEVSLYGEFGPCHSGALLNTETTPKYQYSIHERSLIKKHEPEDAGEIGFPKNVSHVVFGLNSIGKDEKKVGVWCIYRSLDLGLTLTCGK